jgi:hypothetical protein
MCVTYRSWYFTLPVRYAEANMNQELYYTIPDQKTPDDFAGTRSLNDLIQAKVKPIATLNNVEDPSCIEGKAMGVRLDVN